MQAWQIILIVVAAVIVVVAAAFAISAYLAVRWVLGRKKSPTDIAAPERYGVDISWFDAVKGNTEELTIVSYDGLKLRACLISHGDKARKVAICQHGYTASPISMQAQAEIFYDNGFDVLLPTARAHGASEGKYIGLAWLDRFDVMRWVNKIIELYGSGVDIALMGVSMGGSTVVAVAGMNPPPQVKLVIDDCGFSSQRDELLYNIEIQRLPKALVFGAYSLGVRAACGYSVNDADITRLAQNVAIPALFIHGDKDKFVPYSLGRKLFDACGSSDKSFYTAVGAAHAEAFAIDRDKYKETVSSFVNARIR